MVWVPQNFSTTGIQYLGKDEILVNSKLPFQGAAFVAFCNHQVDTSFSFHIVGTPELQENLHIIYLTAKKYTWNLGSEHYAFI